MGSFRVEEALAGLRQQLHLLERIIPDMEALAGLQAVSAYLPLPPDITVQARKVRGKKRAKKTTGAPLAGAGTGASSSKDHLLAVLGEEPMFVTALAEKITERGWVPTKFPKETVRQALQKLEQGGVVRREGTAWVLASPAKPKEESKLVTANQAILSTLSDAGKPLPTPVVLEGVFARGWVTSAKQPIQVIRAAMSGLKKDNRVKKWTMHGDVVWGLPTWGKAALKAAEALGEG